MRRRLEGAKKAEARPFAEYDPLCVHSYLRSKFLQERSLIHSHRIAETTIKMHTFIQFSGGVGQGGRDGVIVQNAIFRGKRHDNKILKVEILLSRNFVVMAQVPTFKACL